MSFCQYETSYAGKCLMYIKDGGDRCKRHKSLIEKPKRNVIPRFRGQSKYQKEMEMFTGKNE